MGWLRACARGDGAWLYFELRNLSSRAPRLRVWHWHFEDWRSRKAARAGYAKLKDRQGFRQLRDGAAFEYPVPELADASESVLVDEIAHTIEPLVSRRVFDPDIRYQRKHR
jgi:hypothetical protein